MKMLIYHGYRLASIGVICATVCGSVFGAYLIGFQDGVEDQIERQAPPPIASDLLLPEQPKLLEKTFEFDINGLPTPLPAETAHDLAKDMHLDTED